MLLNYGVGKDPWESLGLQGDPTSPFYRKSVLNIHWKDWCWSWSSNTLAIWCKELTHWERPWCWERLKAGGDGDDRRWDGWMASAIQWTWVWVSSGSWWWTRKPGMLQSMDSQWVGPDWATELNEKEWRQKEKGVAEDDMIRQCHFLNGHESEQTLGDGEGQGSLVCCSPWGHKVSDMTQWLNSNNQISVAARGVFGLCWSIWDLVPWPGIRSRLPAWRAQSLSHWPSREVPPITFLGCWVLCGLCFPFLKALPSTHVKQYSEQELKMADDLCLQCYGWIPTSHLDSPPEPISHQHLVPLLTIANTWPFGNLDPIFQSYLREPAV